MYNCVCVTGRTYCIGTASQSIVKHSNSGQLETMKMNLEHTMEGGGEGCCSSHSPNIEIKKRKNSFWTSCCQTSFVIYPSAKPNHWNWLMTNTLVFRNIKEKDSVFVRYKLQVKGKFTLEQATKAPRGSRGIDLLFLFPQHNMVMGCQRHPPVTLRPGNARYP